MLSSDTIAVHDGMEVLREFVAALESRRSLIGAQLMQNWRDGCPRLLLSPLLVVKGN